MDDRFLSGFNAVLTTYHKNSHRNNAFPVWWEIFKTYQNDISP
jgi:hypothetical protein